MGDGYFPCFVAKFRRGTLIISSVKIVMPKAVKFNSAAGFKGFLRESDRASFRLSKPSRSNLRTSVVGNVIIFFCGSAAEKAFISWPRHEGVVKRVWKLRAQRLCSKGNTSLG